MTTRVEKSVTVGVLVRTAYNQWTQFEEFPRFMNGVESVTQLGDDRLQWVAEIGGVRREWTARILQQEPDRKVAWAAEEGATNAGAVTFEDAGGDRAIVNLTLEYEPEGFLEHLGDKLGIVENRAERDLDRFKEFVESEGYAAGGWRGSISERAGVGTPGVEDAAASRGDSGEVDDPADRDAAGTDDLELGIGVTGGAPAGSVVLPDVHGNGTGGFDEDPQDRRIN